MKLSELLKKHDFKFSKKYGQNFISENALLEKIVKGAGVGENDVVLEIGCGAGTLTKELCSKAKFVYGYEIDETLRPVLKENLSGIENCEINFRDIMREKTENIEKNIGDGYTIVANLPYYITSPLIMKFVEESKNCKAIVVMVQEEVADRICAEPGTAEYGAITAGINAVCNSEKLFFVSRDIFFPKPNVDSAVVKIVFDRNKFHLKSRAVYRETVRVAFASRRKTLVNNLMLGMKLPRETAEKLLTDCGIDVKARGEVLSAEQFVDLSNAIYEARN